MCYSRLPASSFKEKALLWEEITARSVYFSKKWELFGQSVGSELKCKLSFLLIFKFLLLENMVQQNLQLYCSLNYKTVALFKSAI